MVTSHSGGQVEFRCDGCLVSLTDASRLRTWPSRDAALDELVLAHGWGWVDGRLRCARCLRAAACEITGHAYGSWSDVGPDQLRRRCCQVCSQTQQAPSYVA